MINPFIIHWDIDPRTIDADIASRICDELIESKIFILNLRDISTPLCNETICILKRLSGQRIKINLTAKSTAMEKFNPDTLKNAGLSKLYIEFELLEDMRSSLTEISAWIEQGLPVGLSFYLNKMNFKDVPSVISFCIDNNIKELKFPIQRADKGRIFYPDPEAASQLDEGIRNIPVDRVKLTIHDPFIWQLIYSKDNPNEAGCHGAKTMMFISGNFDVTPCPILPVSMGNLRLLFCKDIFSSEKRREIRERLSSPPKDCGGCPIVSKCIGGCRGRAYALCESFDKQDPACFLI